MSTVLVEARLCPDGGLALDAIAETCREIGHFVYRWRGPYSGRVPYWKSFLHCDLAVIFNGSHEKYDPIVQRLREMGSRLLFVEVGWFPQRDTVQIDPLGINANASWVREPLVASGRTPLPIRPEGDLLLVLQLDGDSQIQRLSPWFSGMEPLVEFVCRHSALPVRVRAHPKSQSNAALKQLVSSLGGAWDTSPSLQAAMQSCRAVACVNSSCGVEALAQQLPLLCYGQATYRHGSAAYCLDNDPAKTREATGELAAGRSRLSLVRLQELYGRIMEHQWPLASIRDKLPPLLRQVLPDPDTRVVPSLPWTRFIQRVIGDIPGVPASPRRKAA
jgi:capsular polysaccharide biosynthesis protein